MELKELQLQSRQVSRFAVILDSLFYAMSTGKRKHEALLEAEQQTASEQQGELDVLLRLAARGGNTAEVTRLLAKCADPNGHKDMVRACACTTSLSAAPAPLPRPCQLRGTYHHRHAAAARRRTATPPS